MKEYTRKESIDYEETFPHVAMPIRILVPLVAYYDYEIWQMDSETLNGHLDEDI